MAHLQQQTTRAIQFVPHNIQFFPGVRIIKTVSQLMNILPYYGQWVANLMHLSAQFFDGNSMVYPSAFCFALEGNISFLKNDGQLMDKQVYKLSGCIGCVAVGTQDKYAGASVA